MSGRRIAWLVEVADDIALLFGADGTDGDDEVKRPDRVALRRCDRWEGGKQAQSESRQDQDWTSPAVNAQSRPAPISSLHKVEYPLLNHWCQATTEGLRGLGGDRAGSRMPGAGDLKSPDGRRAIFTTCADGSRLHRSNLRS
jgi:hypothetical protein